MFAFTRRLVQRSTCLMHHTPNVRQSIGRWCGNTLLCSALGYAYWDSQGINDQEISQAIREFINTSKVFFDHHQHHQYHTKSNDSKRPNDTSYKETQDRRRRSISDLEDKPKRPSQPVQNDREVDLCPVKRRSNSISESLGDGWEQIIVKDTYQVWRQLMPNSSTYKYKVFGTFTDISPRDFFIVQMDTEYRKQWDSLIVRLDVVDREKSSSDALSTYLARPGNCNFDSGNEVIQWIMHYPYPMYCREYCYVRRALVLKKENLVVVISKACSHPNCEGNANGKHVRVANYESSMVIRPHRSFDELGFDYYLTYYDDPKAYIPMSAYNWIASSGLPGFVENLHKAALQLPDERRKTMTSNGAKYLSYSGLEQPSTNDKKQNGFAVS